MRSDINLIRQSGLEFLDHDRLSGGNIFNSHNNYDSIILSENILISWHEFEKGKKNRKDVFEFSLRLMLEIFSFYIQKWRIK